MEKTYKLTSKEVQNIVNKATNDDYPLDIIEYETQNFDMDNLTTNDIIYLFGAFGIKNKKMDTILTNLKK